MKIQDLSLNKKTFQNTGKIPPNFKNNPKIEKFMNFQNSLIVFVFTKFIFTNSSLISSETVE